MGRKQEKFLCVVCRSSVRILPKDGECDIIRRTFEVDGIIAFFWKGAVKYVGLSEDRGKGESLLLQTSVRFSGEKVWLK